ncbi:Ketosteroid isomerase-related protein [Actinopolymorpha cephalotaxi]|uniref:Ketosteroid isomerase-like protein n=1 Tax=Actinopolymorpha cephalotaxi TaxID=504797 RepID=A0A1I2YE60_9ACTN|nr:nuclear transport factor 2 family protein [Actinopolymorpha cephalotaxi]NYH87027.1 ketosteroid isomerase-like protein [Actinopolymorpha cephalotaxi]SFH23627.1 Ketosteroid isomerase-related protein [Actinopolymorpha cephalotaxi]
MSEPTIEQTTEPTSEPTTGLTPRLAFERFRRSVLSGTTDDSADQAEDVVVEWPFNPPGRPHRLQGRSRLEALTRAGRAALPMRIEDVPVVAIHDSLDPEVAIVEYELAGTLTATGERVSGAVLVLLRVRDGQVVHVREYQDVVAMAQAFGRFDELVAAVKEAAAADPPDAESAPTHSAHSADSADPAGTGPRAVFARYQQAVLANSREEMADLFAPDGVQEFPFRLPGIPERLEGREAVRSWLSRNAGQLIRFEAYRNVVVHDTTDPEVIVVEHDIDCTHLPTGRPLRMSYVYVLRVRDGQITLLRDYANLLPVLGARLVSP